MDMSTSGVYPNRSSSEDKDNSSLMETPVGDQDQSPKVQLCLELREILSKRNRKEFQLDVVVMKVKNISHQPTSKSTDLKPFVKLAFDHGNQLQLRITELIKPDKENSNIFFFAEPFGFKLRSKKPAITGKTLHVEVCDGIVTRQARCFGKVEIPLDDVHLGKPVSKWFLLS